MEKMSLDVVLPELGQIEIIMNEEQMKKALNDGKDIFQKYNSAIALFNQKVKTEDYIYMGGMETKNKKMDLLEMFWAGILFFQM